MLEPSPSRGRGVCGTQRFKDLSGVMQAKLGDIAGE